MLRVWRQLVLLPYNISHASFANARAGAGILHRFSSAAKMLDGRAEAEVEEEDFEEAMARIEKLTERPPPKLPHRTKAPHKNVELQHERIFRPFPSFNDLPVDAYRIDAGNGRTSDGAMVFARLDPAQNFINLYCTRHEVAPLKLYRLQHYDQHTRQVMRVRVAAVIPLVPDVRAAEWRDVDRVIGIGEGRTLTDARKAARMDLAERLYRVMEDPRSLTETKGVQSCLEDSYVRIGLREGTRALLQDAVDLIEDQRPFDLEQKTEILKNDVPRSRKHTSLPKPSNLEPSLRIKANSLPVCRQYREILEAIDRHQVTVISAATGSGKTTQLPQFLMEQWSGSGHAARILVTQPRRIAAKSVAQRVAHELGEPVGNSVGYAVRFDTRMPVWRPGKSTSLFCTGGVLLKRLQEDPELTGITHLVLDEVHERDVNTDVLLMLARRLLTVRRDSIRLVLMSATMPIDRLVEYFGSAGHAVGLVPEISGTNHPVKQHYLRDILTLLSTTKKGQYLKRLGELPEECREYVEAELEGPGPESAGLAGTSEALKIERNELKVVPYEVLVALISLLDSERGPGAILCFLPGWEEITGTQKAIQAVPGLASRLSLHLLHSTAPVGAADEVFLPSPPDRRKVILATNLAESSITLPDVVFVLDAAKQKLMHYDQRHRMNLLECSWTSRASLRQRMGRAGRVQAGEYYSLICKERAQSLLPEQTPPELLRLGLEEVCLAVMAMPGVAAPGERVEQVLAEAVDPPDAMAVRQALERLEGLGALEPQTQELTPLGRLLAALPIHPALGRMLAMSVVFKCVDPVLSVVAGIGERIFRAARTRDEKAAMHRLLLRLGKDLHSDHLLLHRLYTMWQGDLSLSALGLARSDNNPHSSVSFLALRRMHEVRKHLERILKETVKTEHQQDWNAHAGNESLLRMVISTGFYPDIAVYKGKRNAYQLRKIREAKPPITSALYEPGPELLRALGHARKPASLPRPVFYVYEDLMDVGAKMIMRVTAVDPLVFILLGRKLNVRAVHGSPPGLLVDGWLSVQPSDAHCQADLPLISRARVLLTDYLQWAVSRMLVGGPSVTQEQIEAAQAFERALLALVAQSNVFRQRVLSQ